MLFNHHLDVKQHKFINVRKVVRKIPLITMLEYNVTVITNIGSEYKTLKEEAMGKISLPPPFQKSLIIQLCTKNIHLNNL